MPQNPEVRMSPSGPVIATGAGADFLPLTLTYYVDAEYDGSSGVSNGSIARPYTTLQAGFDALQAVSSEFGTLIVVPRPEAPYDPLVIDVVEDYILTIVSTAVISEVPTANSSWQSPAVSIESITTSGGLLNLVGIYAPTITLAANAAVELTITRSVLGELDATAVGASSSLKAYESSINGPVQTGGGDVFAYDTLFDVGFAVTCQNITTENCRTTSSGNWSVAGNATFRDFQGTQANAALSAVSVVQAYDSVLDNFGSITCSQIGAHDSTFFGNEGAAVVTATAGALLYDCDNINLVALEATLIGCTISTLGNLGTSGGAHLNPAFYLLDCTFSLNPVLQTALGGGGARFDIYADDQSRLSFETKGGTITGTGSVVFYDTGAVGSIQAYALDATNTVDTSGDSLYHGVTGSQFGLITTPSNNPWTLTAAGCVVSYEAAYIGAGTPPPTPTILVRVSLKASVSSVAGGTVGAGISYQGGVIGGAITERGDGQQVVTVPAGVITQVSTELVIAIANATLQTIRPAFASTSGDDLTIESLSMSIDVLPFPRGY